MNRKKLLIFPYSGTGLEALDAISDEYDLLGFIDDDPGKQGTGSHGWRVHDRSVLQSYTDSLVLLVPGSPTSYLHREELISSFGIDRKRFAVLIHPWARVSPLARLGTNILIMAGVVITSDAWIGDHVCVLPNTVIHHGVQIDDFALIGTQVCLAGEVKIGRNAYIGSGTTVLGGVTVGERALIGMGSNVLRTVEPGSRVAGNPAREIGRH
jgi:sugar O-acyltransferase (sialic acid O-acetyltransferase NeuD family)